MKVLIICLAGLLAVGCDFSVHGYEIEKYIEACKENNGIRSIDNITRTVQCNNGKWFRTSDK